MPAKLNLINKKFGQLTVIKRIKLNVVHWKCRCTCGKINIVDTRNLMSGHTKSCGCLWIKSIAASKRNFQHGMYHTRLYHIWANMKYRCNKPFNKDWDNYGKRGIKVCNSWLKFINFKNDMLESYEYHVKLYGEKQTTLERINGNLGYSLRNCKWATYKEQNNNSRNCVNH